MCIIHTLFLRKLFFRTGRALGLILRYLLILGSLLFYFKIIVLRNSIRFSPNMFLTEDANNLIKVQYINDSEN
jgi:hypothetical protein